MKPGRSRLWLEQWLTVSEKGCDFFCSWEEGYGLRCEPKPFNHRILEERLSIWMQEGWMGKVEAGNMSKNASHYFCFLNVNVSSGQKRLKERCWKYTKDWECVKGGPSNSLANKLLKGILKMGALLLNVWIKPDTLHFNPTTGNGDAIGPWAILWVARLSVGILTSLW